MGREGQGVGSVGIHDELLIWNVSEYAHMCTYLLFACA